MADKHHLVIGGSRGIGLSVVRRLSAKGDSVLVASRNPGEVADLKGVTHLPFDATRDALNNEMLPASLNGFAYCPGTIRLRPISRLTVEDFLEDYHINVIGAVQCLQAALPRLKKSKSGASVVFFSTVAVQTGMPFHASIAGAKGAIEGITRSLAAELAPRIRVNAVAPSLTDTALAESLMGDDDKRKAAAERHPLKRFGLPEDIAACACYLLSDAASWITGQILPVDGGMSSVRVFH